jgi:FAD/FMN-containing dehydrogenase
MSNTALASLANDFSAIVGSEHVLEDEGRRRFFSADLSLEPHEVAALVVAPGSTEELVAVVERANAAGMAVVARGGGMSYTLGYTPARPNTVLLDMRRMNRIREINTDDMYVVAEAGCTWEQLYRELGRHGVRTPYYGPLSGRFATVGGALSQNSLFWGSGMYSTVADCVLGLEIVLAGGRLVRTGSWGRPSTNAFFRHNGPDLTGIFTSDTGAMGVKAAAALRLVHAPAVSLGASFAVPSFEAAIEAMKKIAPLGIVSELYELDPFYHAVLAKAGLTFLAQHDWTVHFGVDAPDEAIGKAQLDYCKRLCGVYGVEIDPATVSVFKNDPFGAVQSVLLGPEGELWLPIHAFLPWSKAQAAREAVERLFERHASTMEANAIKTSVLSVGSGKDFVFEPSFYWRDELGEFRLQKILPEAAEEWRHIPPNEQTRSIVLGLRRELAKTFDEVGCCHIQVGKYYEYESMLTPETWNLVKAVKTAVDPDGLVNPGSLGLACGD